MFVLLSLSVVEKYTAMGCESSMDLVSIRNLVLTSGSLTSWYLNGYIDITVSKLLTFSKHDLVRVSSSLKMIWLRIDGI
jgi:hypothetical protein